MASTTVFRSGLIPGSLTVDVTGLSALTLRTDQAIQRTLQFTGTLSANCTVTFPVATEDAGISWDILNLTTGGYGILCGGSSGVQVPVYAGVPTMILWSGSDMIAIASTGTAAATVQSMREALGAQIIDQAGQYIVPAGAGPHTLGNPQMNPITLTGGTVNATVILPSNYLLTGTGYRSHWLVNNQTAYTISLASDVDTGTLVAVATTTKAIVGLNQYGSLIAFD